MITDIVKIKLVEENLKQIESMIFKEMHLLGWKRGEGSAKYKAYRRVAIRNLLHLFEPKSTVEDVQKFCNDIHIKIMTTASKDGAALRKQAKSGEIKMNTTDKIIDNLVKKDSSETDPTSIIVYVSPIVQFKEDLSDIKTTPVFKILKTYLKDLIPGTYRLIRFGKAEYTKAAKGCIKLITTELGWDKGVPKGKVTYRTFWKENELKIMRTNHGK